jgi:signal peptidase I
MQSRIISSGKISRKNPLAAAALSLFIPGMGQVYNGTPSEGIVLLMVTVFPVFMIPVYMSLGGGSPAGYIVFILFSAFSWIVSVVRAAVGAVKMRSEYHMLKAAVLYSIFASAALVLLFLSFMCLYLFVGLAAVDSDAMKPGLLKGEYILINRFAAENIARGDAVRYAKGGGTAFGRIIALPGDTAACREGLFSVNGIDLPFGVPDGDELRGIGYDNLEEVFFEINGPVKYAILRGGGAKGPAEKTAPAAPVKLEKNSFLVAADNRMNEGFYEIITEDEIDGRIEGIIMGRDIRRALMPPRIK